MATEPATELAKLKSFENEWFGPSPTIIAHTSGSTGVPKQICLSKEDMRRSARATNSFFGIDRNSLLASPLSVDYIAGKMMYVRAFEAGCRIFQLPVSNKLELPADCGKIRLLPVVPSQLQSLIEQPHLASVVENVLIGGAPPAAEMCDALTQAGYTAWISYGMTETASHVALARGDDASRVFEALPGIRFETGESGQLVIVAPERKFGRLVTTDVVELLSPRSFKWLGRLDNVINSGGVKIHPEQLESKLAPVLQPRRFFIASGKHPKWGMTPILVFEGDDAEAEAILATACKAIPDHRLRPTKAVAVNTLPLTENGKLKRFVPEQD